MQLRSILAPLAVSGAIFASCSSDGATAVCPDLRLYDFRDLDAEVPKEAQEAEKAAVDAGCMTARGDAKSVILGVDGGGGRD